MPFLQLIPFEIWKAYNGRQKKEQKLWLGYETNYQRQRKSNPTSRFFYKKKPKSKPKEIEKNNNLQIPKQSGYIFATSSNSSPINIFHQLHEEKSEEKKEKQKISIREKTIRRYGKFRIAHLESFMKTKMAIDKRLGLVFNNGLNIRFYNKRELIRRTNKIYSYLRSRQQYFHLPWQLTQYCLQKLYCQRHFISKLCEMLKRHQRIISKFNLSSLQTILHNDECPLTLTAITQTYLQCITSNCEMCYDYESTKDYFFVHPMCSYCRKPMNITPLHVDVIKQQILCELKNHRFSN